MCVFRSGLAFGGVRVRCLCVRCVLCLVCLPLRVRPRVCPVLVLRFYGMERCPLAGRKGNGVSYTLLKTRKSQKQRLQHNSASRAPLSLGSGQGGGRVG